MKKMKENNKIIAEFMGFKVDFIELDKEFKEPIFEVYSNTHLFASRFRITNVAIEDGFDKNDPSKYFLELYKSIFKYHSSWNWLMPVVEKIESYLFITSIQYGQKYYWAEIWEHP